ncbi:hypothetical protein [Methanoregula sp.]|jgi:hypothetical protein|uniref:hypothetical protein n=1 Tax=Methanoregula sp. TaxID=2052170 RepID=UPI003C22A68E
MDWWKKRPISFLHSGARGLFGVLLFALFAPVRADSSSTMMYGPPPLGIIVTDTFSSVIHQYALVIAGIIILIAAGILVRLHRKSHPVQQEKKT